MLTCLLGAYLAANQEDVFSACIAAVAAMGLAGEIADRPAYGTLTFRAAMVDAISLMTAAQLDGGAKVEYI